MFRDKIFEQQQHTIVAVLLTFQIEVRLPKIVGLVLLGPNNIFVHSSENKVIYIFYLPSFIDAYFAVHDFGCLIVYNILKLDCTEY